MTLDLGAGWLGDGRCRFRVWAPRADRVDVRLESDPPRTVRLQPAGRGYREADLDGLEPGALYKYVLNETTACPDPAARFQPRGVHGPSQIVDPAAMAWTDADWRGLPLEQFVLYELHVGAFTAEGTFDAVIPRLDDLRDLGVTAIELMPVAQFPGDRNWGYDGVCPFAVQESYGGPPGLNRLVDACHRRGLAVVLDVVYNHLGPEGNSLGRFGPYFSEVYRTPWGDAINFDGPHSDEVRHFFIRNALYWIEEFHVDALRLDAIHGILDRSARPFLAELADAVHDSGRRAGRQVQVISESDLNDVRVLRSVEQGGFGHDGQWNDDFHHALHVLLTGERQGYYGDYRGLEDLLAAHTDGFVLAGRYSEFRQRRHGNSSRGIALRRLVVFSQNHDQVGNRLAGDRLSRLADFEALKLAAGAVLLAPGVPLLFMGEEYGETAPFPYFVSHGDPELIEAVRRGRASEFAAFQWKGEIPDPQDEETFLRAKLDPGLAGREPHRTLRAFYAELLRLRRERPVLGPPVGGDLTGGLSAAEGVIWIRRDSEAGSALVLYNFSAGTRETVLPAPAPASAWRKVVDSSEPCWRGPRPADAQLDRCGPERPLTIHPRSLILFEPDRGGER